MQPYMKEMSVDKCRTKFRVRTEMLKDSKDNYRSKYRTMERGQEEDDPGLRCQECRVHCLVCPAWTYLREDLDLTDIRCMDDMVTFFQRVIKAREEKSDREKRRRKTERDEEEKLRQEVEGQKRK